MWGRRQPNEKEYLPSIHLVENYYSEHIEGSKKSQETNDILKMGYRSKKRALKRKEKKSGLTTVSGKVDICYCRILSPESFPPSSETLETGCTGKLSCKCRVWKPERVLERQHERDSPSFACLQLKGEVKFGVLNWNFMVFMCLWNSSFYLQGL